MPAAKALVLRFVLHDHLLPTDHLLPEDHVLPDFLL
jgi:hypothetical protein